MKVVNSFVEGLTFNIVTNKYLLSPSTKKKFRACSDKFQRRVHKASLYEHI